VSDVRARIEAILRGRFRPARLEIRDDSAAHAGHAGAASGGGHYDILIVSAEFEGKPLLDRHRLVNDALRELIGREIHALALKTRAPSE
jgi:BolA protein